MKAEYPTLKQIKTDYWELVGMVKDIVTKEQAEDFERKNYLKIVCIEIDGVPVKEYTGTDKDIEYIRYECYGCLEYIYFYIEDGKITDIRFNIDELSEVTGIGNWALHELTAENFEKLKELYKTCKAIAG